MYDGKENVKWIVFLRRLEGDLIIKNRYIYERFLGIRNKS